MSCQRARKSISELLDHRLPGHERARLAEHMGHCHECAAAMEEMSANRGVLRSLPMVAVPPRVQTKLLVSASRERARWNSMKTLPLALVTISRNLWLLADNLMRPLALPFAGGLLSALALFALLVPTLGFKHNVRNDVPTGFYTAATLVDVPSIGIGNDDALVMLYVDDKGQAMDYAVQHGSVSPEMQADIHKMMVFSRFIPATWFGQPTNGKVLVLFRHMNYVVRG